MADPATGGRSPGWYPDHEDPTRLRYWNGAWTARRRARPAWDVCNVDWQPPDSDTPQAHVLEGPVRTAELPAIATAVSRGREVIRSSDTPLSGRRRPGHQPALVARVTHHRPRDPARRSPPWSGQHDAMMILCLIAVVAVLAMFVSVGMARRPVYTQWVLSDQAFIAQANAACASTLPGLREPSPQAPTASGSQALEPATVATDATGIDALASGLLTIPLRGVDRLHIQGWLADWHIYTADERAYAAYLEQPPAQADPAQTSKLLADAGAAMARADTFAVDEGLVSCTLSAHPGSLGAQPFT